MLPRVAIVGRPNVGKSTLLNAVARRRVSIVDPTPGTTRDRVSLFTEHAGRYFELVDTGGIVEEAHTPVDRAVQDQVAIALGQADVILFVVDVRDGILAADQRLAMRLRGCGRPVLLVANKADTEKIAQESAVFFRLGLGEPVLISALQRTGIRDLLGRVVAALPHDVPDAPAPAEMKLAIVGRRNVGKSTWVNHLAGEERVIANEEPGTTRDSVDVRIEHDGHAFVLIDTAGLRKKGKTKDTIEQWSRMRSFSAIKRADVVLFLLDAASEVSEVDKRIADFIQDEARPVIIVFNKWDLAEKVTTPDAYVKYLNAHFPALRYAPIALASAKTGFNVSETLKLARELFRQAGERIPTPVLNRLVARAREVHGPRAQGGKLPKIYYATQISVCPPTIVLFVNRPSAFPDDYRRFLAGKFREESPFPEVPIRLLFRTRGEKKKHRKKSGIATPELPLTNGAPPEA